MIYAFTGKTGSGKTFRMVKYAYKEWLHGSDVYSNTVLLFETARLPIWWKFKKLFKKPQRGRITYFEDITEILEARNGVILFDEAQVLFNARSWESLPKEFQYKLQQHRKHRLDLYCTTQNMGAIDITYRRLVQFWYHHESAFQLRENPVWFGFFRANMKDVDLLYNTVDDLKVDDIKKHLSVTNQDLRLEFAFLGCLALYFGIGMYMVIAGYLGVLLLIHSADIIDYLLGKDLG